VTTKSSESVTSVGSYEMWDHFTYLWTEHFEIALIGVGGLLLQPENKDSVYQQVSLSTFLQLFIGSYS